MQKHAKRVISLCFAAGMMMGTAQAEPADLATEFDPALRKAERLGTLLAAKEAAVSVATVHLGKKSGFRKDTRVQGWLSEPMEGGWRVHFISEIRGNPKALYTVEVVGDAIAGSSSSRNGKALSDALLAKWTARGKALSSSVKPCTPTYNTAVIPFEADAGRGAGHYTYLLPKVDNPGILLVGGFYRIDVAADGTIIDGVRKYTADCTAYRLPEGEIDGLSILHDYAPHPEEIHVHLSLQRNLALYMTTTQNGATWEVADGKIALLDEADTAALPDTVRTAAKDCAADETRVAGSLFENWTAAATATAIQCP